MTRRLSLSSIHSVGALRSSRLNLTAGKFGILQGETGNPDYDYSIGEAVEVQDVPENTPVVYGGNPEKPDTFEDIPF